MCSKSRGDFNSVAQTICSMLSSWVGMLPLSMEHKRHTQYREIAFIFDIHSCLHVKMLCSLLYYYSMRIQSWIILCMCILYNGWCFDGAQHINTLNQITLHFACSSHLNLQANKLMMLILNAHPHINTHARIHARIKLSVW